MKKKLKNEKKQILQKKLDMSKYIYIYFCVSIILGVIAIYYFIQYRKKIKFKLNKYLDQISSCKNEIENNKYKIKSCEGEIQDKSCLLKIANVKLEELENLLSELQLNKDRILKLKKETELLKQSRDELKIQIALLVKRNDQAVIINKQIMSQSTLLERLKVWNQGDHVFTETEWLHLSDLMNEHYNNFTKRLVEKYPSLKPHDVLICNLTKLGLSNETIALLTNCKYETILTKRTRIKKLRMREIGDFSLEKILNQLE